MIRIVLLASMLMRHIRSNKNCTSNKNIILIGALLKSNDENEKIHIINLLFDGKMKEIISKNFL